MSGRLAILAGQGRLPVLLAQADPDALVVGFHSVPVDDALTVAEHARFERFGALFDALKAQRVTRVVFAGGLIRPQLDPAAFDATTQALAPRIGAALQGGDDGLLRTVVAIFEENGFAVVGAHEVRSELVMQIEPLTEAKPAQSDQADAAQGRDILSSLGPLDLGQACVVAGGLCLGIETAQGTAEMLRFVAGTRDRLRPRRGGVLVKRSKPDQDLRVDMPAIGPDTVDQAVAAGLRGIEIEAGRVLVLDRGEVIVRANAVGLAIWGVA